MKHREMTHQMGKGDHMTRPSGEGSKDLMGMKQTSYDTKMKGGDDPGNRETMRGLEDVTDGEPNS